MHSHSRLERHLWEIEEGSRHVSAMEQNLCRLLHLVSCMSLPTHVTVSPCTLTVGVTLQLLRFSWLCSDLAYNCKSSCVLVGQIALLCGTTLWKALLCNHDNFSRLLSPYVDSRVTNLVLATCMNGLWSDTSLAVKSWLHDSQCCSALLAHARPTMFCIPLVSLFACNHLDCVTF